MTASGSSMQSILFHNSTIGVALWKEEEENRVRRIEWNGVEWKDDEKAGMKSKQKK